MVKDAFGVNWVHVPYRGSGPALTDLLAGQVDVSVVGLNSVVSRLESGNLRALAVMGDTRAPLLPNVPTMSEIKPGLEVEFWLGLSLPAKTPPAIVGRLQQMVEQALADPEVRAQLQKVGAEPLYRDGPSMRRRIAQEIENHIRIGRQAGISPGN